MSAAFLCAVICDSALEYKEQWGTISFATRNKGQNMKEVDAREANKTHKRTQQQKSKSSLES